MRTLSASWLRWWETQHPAALQQSVRYLATVVSPDMQQQAWLLHTCTCLCSASTLVLDSVCSATWSTAAMAVSSAQDVPSLTGWCCADALSLTAPDDAVGPLLTGPTCPAGGGLTGVPVFVQRHAGAAAYRRTGGQQQQQVEPEEAVAFRVMLRRGGREDKTKAVQVSCCMLPLQGAALSRDCARLLTTSSEPCEGNCVAHNGTRPDACLLVARTLL